MGQGIFSRRKVIESGLLLVPAVAFAPSLSIAACKRYADRPTACRFAPLCGDGGRRQDDLFGMRIF